MALQPRSRGRVSLIDPDPLAKPRIDAGYLTDPGGSDLAVLRHGLRLARRILGTEPLASEITAELIAGLSLQSDTVTMVHWNCVATGQDDHQQAHRSSTPPFPSPGP